MKQDARHGSPPRPPVPAQPDRQGDQAFAFARTILRRVGIRPLLTVVLALALATPDAGSAQSGPAKATATARATARIVTASVRVGPTVAPIDRAAAQDNAVPVARVRPCDPEPARAPQSACTMIVIDMP